MHVNFQFNTNLVVFLVAVLIVGFSLSTYYSAPPPEKPAAFGLSPRLTAGGPALGPGRVANETRLQECRDRANAAYETRWKASCSDRNLFSACSLPSAVADAYSRGSRHARDECFRRYPTN